MQRGLPGGAALVDGEFLDPRTLFDAETDI